MVGLILHASETKRIIYCAWDKRIEDNTIQDASNDSHNSIISCLQQCCDSLPCKPPTAVGCTDVPQVPSELCLASTHVATCILPRHKPGGTYAVRRQPQALMSQPIV